MLSHLDFLKAKVDSVSACCENARVKINVCKHLRTVKCGNRLRVGVRSNNASVSGLACRLFAAADWTNPLTA